MLTKNKKRVIFINVDWCYADMAELADALDLGSSASSVGVQVPLSAPSPQTVVCGLFYLKK